MPESYPFANQSISASEWGRMARMWQSSGVAAGTGNMLEPSLSGSNVIINTGAVWLRGFYYYSQSTKSVPITVGSSNFVCASVNPDSPSSITFVRRSSNPARSDKSIFPLAYTDGSRFIDYRRWAGRRIVSFILGNGASLIPTGTKPGITMPDDYVITAWRMFADYQGYLSVDILKTSFEEWTKSSGTKLFDTMVINGSNRKASYPAHPSSSPYNMNNPIRINEIIKPHVHSVSNITQATVELWLAPLLGEE